MVKDTPNDQLEILIHNTLTIQAHHMNLAAMCRREAPSCPNVESGIWTTKEAERFNLADRLKDSYELMIDNIDVRSDKNFSSGEMPLFRRDVIEQWARFAFESMDWTDLADGLLSKLDELSPK